MMKATLRRHAFAAVLATGTCTTLPVAGQTPTPVTISVDAREAGTPLERVWAFHGYDEANYTTTPEGKALLLTLAAAHTAPVYVRTHFLLNTGDGAPALKWGSTNVYTEDASGNAVYSWTILDGIFDTIIASGAFPLVEIGFMPQALSTRPNPYRNSTPTSTDGGCLYPPKDYAKWAALIRAVATHVRDRYPGAEMSWQWELWNEADISYWHGTAAEFQKLYDYTENALHAVFPNASLGGPAAANGTSAFFKQFLTHCAEGSNAVSGATGTRLDMVSFHAKGGVAMVSGHVQMNLGRQLRLHRDGFAAVAAVPKFKQTPIVLTEADPDGCAGCPASDVPADAYRNSPAYGAYEVAMMKRTLELEARLGVNLRGVLTWAFTFPGTPYFAGYRALATNGIHLPVLGAFQLLGSLDGNRIPVVSSGARTLDDILADSVRQQPDVDALATKLNHKVQVLVWNYHDDLVASTAPPVHLSVSLPSDFGARAKLDHLRVDEEHGDAYTVWVAQGKPQNPSQAQITALQQAMDPVALETARAVDVVGGKVDLDLTLPRFGISLLTIATDSAGAGAGGSATGGGAGGTSAGGSSSGGTVLGGGAGGSPVTGGAGSVARGGAGGVDQGSGIAGGASGAASGAMSGSSSGGASSSSAGAGATDTHSGGALPTAAGGSAGALATASGAAGVSSGGNAMAGTGATGANPGGCSCSLGRQPDFSLQARWGLALSVSLALCFARRRRQRTVLRARARGLACPRRQ